MLQRMAKAAGSSSSGMLLLDVLLPGLVLTLLELRTRKAWLEQHWIAAPSSATAAAATGATAAPAAPASAPADTLEQQQLEQQQQEKPEAQLLQALTACSATSSSSSSSGEAQHAAMPATLHALAPAGVCPPTAEAASAAAGGHSSAADADAANIVVSAAQQQGMPANRLRYRSLVSRRVVSFKFTQAPGEALVTALAVFPKRKLSNAYCSPALITTDLAMR
jgi:hypothetical protein